MCVHEAETERWVCGHMCLRVRVTVWVHFVASILSFSLSIFIWDPGIKLRFLAWPGSTFTHWAIPPVWVYWLPPCPQLNNNHHMGFGIKTHKSETQNKSRLCPSFWFTSHWIRSGAWHGIWVDTSLLKSLASVLPHLSSCLENSSAGAMVFPRRQF